MSLVKTSVKMSLPLRTDLGPEDPLRSLSASILH